MNLELGLAIIQVNQAWAGHPGHQALEGLGAKNVLL
jgi:hypothetical protein